MKVLITGGTGYIGTSLCLELRTNPDIEKVIIYDNLSRKNYNLFIGVQKLDDRFEFVEGDILDSRKLRKAVHDCDLVYHLAAKVSTPFADQDAHLFEQVNHWGTAELSYAVEESNAKSLVYLSSVSVYGSGPDMKNLAAARNPRTFYGISKMRGEEHMSRLADKVDTYVYRCGNVYGYNKSMRFDAVINKFMFEANFHRKINIHGNGGQHRPFIYVDSVARTLADIVSGNSRTGIENLVEHNFSINDIVGVLLELYPDLEVIYINQSMKLRELVVESAGNVLKPEALTLLKERLTTFKSAFTV